MNEMEEQLINDLDECLAAIQAGETIESCLTRYANDAGELAPLLQIALALEKLPQAGPSTAVTRAAKTQFLAEAERRRTEVQRPSFRRRLTSVWVWIIRHLSLPTWPAPARTLATAAMSLALVLVIGGGVINAAGGSLPGDPLYGFKLLGEDIQHALTLGQDSRIRLEGEFTERRRDEVGRLLTLGRQEEVTFGGLLRERSGNLWRIENIPVAISETTQVQADPALQAFVKIHGTTQADGTVLAQLVQIEGDTIVGLVDAITPDQWRIAGRDVQVDDETFIQDQISVGDCVEVHTRRFSDGTLLALEIETSGDCQGDAAQDTTPEARETPRPTLTNTPTPQPSPTPSPIWSPTPSTAPSREATPTPSVTPEPEDDDDTEPESTPALEASPVPPSAPVEPSPTPTDESDDDDRDDNANDNDNDDEDDGNDNTNDNDDEDDGNDNTNDNDNDGGDDDNANDDNTNDNDNDSGDNDNANDNESDDGDDNANDENTNDNDNGDSSSADRLTTIELAWLITTPYGL